MKTTTLHAIATRPEMSADERASYEAIGLDPTTRDGHWKSEAILIIAGSSRAGGPGGWLVGGWSAEGTGRTVYAGPMVPGPYAFVTGRCGVIDTRGGTGRIHADAEAAGNLFRCKAGDHLRLDGVTYELSLCRRGYPSLTVVS